MEKELFTGKYCSIEVIVDKGKIINIYFSYDSKVPSEYRITNRKIEENKKLNSRGEYWTEYFMKLFSWNFDEVICEGIKDMIHAYNISLKHKIYS